MVSLLSKVKHHSFKTFKLKKYPVDIPVLLWKDVSMRIVVNNIFNSEINTMARYNLYVSNMNARAEIY